MLRVDGNNTVTFIGKYHISVGRSAGPRARQPRVGG
jgi:hypothetical protein